jgi:hypothetical protein
MSIVPPDSTDSSYDPQYFDCACYSSEHTLRFMYGEDEIYTEVFLNNYKNIFQRLWTAMKYVCGYKCKYGHFDCFILQQKDAQRLINLLSKVV